MMTKMKEFFTKRIGGENTNKSIGIAFMAIGVLFLILHVYSVECYIVTGCGLGYPGDDVYLLGTLILGITCLLGGNLLRKKPY